MTIDENKRIAHQAFDALAAGDLDAVQELLAPDAVLHQCGFLRPITLHALRQNSQRYPSPVVDRKAQLEQMIAEGDTVALRWRTTGRYADPSKPTLDGVPVTFPSMTFLRIADSRIAEIWNMRDADTLQSALHEAAAGDGD
jgi:ketosteroid isomerase-like protein